LTMASVDEGVWTLRSTRHEGRVLCGTRSINGGAGLWRALRRMLDSGLWIAGLRRVHCGLRKAPGCSPGLEGLDRWGAGYTVPARGSLAPFWQGSRVHLRSGARPAPEWQGLPGWRRRQDARARNTGKMPVHRGGKMPPPEFTAGCPVTEGQGSGGPSHDRDRQQLKPGPRRRLKRCGPLGQKIRLSRSSTTSAGRTGVYGGRAVHQPGWTEWTQGFNTGRLSCNSTPRRAGDARAGRQRTLERMAPHLTHFGVHDHGFNNVSTYGICWVGREAGLRPATGEAVLRLALKVSGRAGQTVDDDPRRGYIYSFNGPHSLFATRSGRFGLGIAHRLGHVLTERTTGGCR